MFLRIESTANLDNTCLSSRHAFTILEKNRVTIWYVDIDILNRFHGGAMKALIELLATPGVASVDILPVERDPFGLQENEFSDLLSCLEPYLDTIDPK